MNANKREWKVRSSAFRRFGSPDSEPAVLPNNKLALTDGVKSLHIKFAVFTETLHRALKALTRWNRSFLVLLGLAAASAVFADMTPEQRKQLPPPVSRPVSFAKEVRPILEASCIKCH